jgi:hypothetical protein
MRELTKRTSITTAAVAAATTTTTTTTTKTDFILASTAMSP